MKDLACAVCGHKWKSEDEPERCASSACRSKKWLDGKDGRSANRFRFTVIVSEDQFGQFERAAKRQGKEPGEWLRDLGIAAIAPPPKFAVEIWPSRKQEVQVVEPGQEPKGYPALAGFGLDVSKFLKDRGIALPTFKTDDPGEDVATRPWLPELIQLQKLGEVDPNASTEEFNGLLGGDGFRAPKGWMNWSLEQRAQWLDQNKPLEIETK